jgi:hypothetical protein
LAVQFTESNGLLKTLLFVALPSKVDDIILQESARREELYRSIYEHGNEFINNSYGTIVFQEDGRFTWTGNSLLVPQIIPASALGSGTLDMRLFLADSLSDRYTGAFTLNFNAIGGTSPVDFMYSLDSQGLRIEHVPQTSLDGITVVRRASSPMVIFFLTTNRSDDRPFYGWDYFQELPNLETEDNYGNERNEGFRESDAPSQGALQDFLPEILF